MTFTPGSKVRIKTDAEWEGISFDAGTIGTVASSALSDTAFEETVWVEFEEGAQAEFDADVLEPAPQGSSATGTFRF